MTDKSHATIISPLSESLPDSKRRFLYRCPVCRTTIKNSPLMRTVERKLKIEYVPDYAFAYFIFVVHDFDFEPQSTHAWIHTSKITALPIKNEVKCVKHTRLRKINSSPNVWGWIMLGANGNQFSGRERHHYMGGLRLSMIYPSVFRTQTQN